MWIRESEHAGDFDDYGEFDRSYTILKFLDWINKDPCVAYPLYFDSYWVDDFPGLPAIS